MTDLLVVDKVSKAFKGLNALKEVSVKIQRGNIYGIIGPNGSGKTTLFNIITGVLRPDSGHVYFMGKQIDGLEPNKIYDLGIARSFQIPTLFMNMTAFENIMVPPKKQIGEKVRNAFFKSKWGLQELQLTDRGWIVLERLNLSRVALNRANEVSGGQMKLMELGRTMMSDPKLILLDEPTAGVNPTLALEIFNTIKRTRDELGLTFIIIEHRYDMLFESADYIYLLNEGEVASEGHPSKVMHDPVLSRVYLGD